MRDERMNKTSIRRKSASLSVTMLAAGLVAGCGGGGGNEASPPAAPPPATTVATTTAATPSQQELAATYLRIVKPANEELDRWFARAQRWTDNTPKTQAVKDSQPLIDAYEEAGSKLLRVPWPEATRADVKDLVRADAALIADLNGLGTVDDLSADQWVSQFQHDASQAGAAANIVRADLGLPPNK
jgi:hypothetical protein